MTFENMVQMMAPMITQAILVLLLLWVSVALGQALNSQSRERWAIYTLSLSLGLYRHPLFWLLGLVHGGYVLTQSRSQLWPYLGSAQFAIATFIPQLSQWLHPQAPILFGGLPLQCFGWLWVSLSVCRQAYLRKRSSRFRPVWPN